MGGRGPTAEQPKGCSHCTHTEKQGKTEKMRPTEGVGITVLGAGVEKVEERKKKRKEADRQKIRSMFSFDCT